jgi:hypothetical protein
MLKAKVQGQDAYCFLLRPLSLDCKTYLIHVSRGLLLHGLPSVPVCVQISSF